MRVLVTRPQPEAARTAERLASLGHAALVAPLFRPEALDAADMPAEAAALAVTSARTVGFLPPGLREKMRDRPAFAVGDRTAEALHRAGFTDIRSAAGDVLALAALIAAAGLASGSLVLSPGGETRAGDLGEALATIGLRVAVPAVYRMVAERHLPSAAREALAAGGIDAVLHYSPNATRAVLRLADEAGLAAALARPVHACLSEAVAAPLRERGIEGIAVAAAPDESALLATLAR